MGVTFIGSIIRDPIRRPSSAIHLFTGMWFVVAFFCALSGYYLRRWRAKRMVEQGEFIEIKGHAD